MDDDRSAELGFSRLHEGTRLLARVKQIRK